MLHQQCRHSMGWNSRVPEIMGNDPDSWSRSLAELQSFQAGDWMKVVRTFSGWSVEQRSVQTFLLWRHPFDRLDDILCIFAPAFIIQCCPWQQLEIHMAHLLPRVGLRRRMLQDKRQPFPGSCYHCSSHHGCVLCCALLASREWSCTQPLMDLIGSTCRQGQAYFSSAGPN